MAALLWPDVPEDRARHNLRQALTVLRRVVGQDGSTPCLIQQRDVLRFDTSSGMRVDVLELRRLLDERADHAHADATRCVPCCRRLEDVATLYRGELLHGFSLPDSDAFEDWLVARRQQMQDEVISALSDLSTCSMSEGQLEAAIGAVRRQLDIDSLHEPAHRRLMSLLWQQGNRSAALAQYERCRQVLDDELGVEPEEETVALYEAIRNGSMVEGSVTSDRETPPSVIRLPPTPTRLVGRQTETREIMDLLTQPECRLLTLTGPGGSGKTRLAVHVAAELADREPGVTCFVPLASARHEDDVVMAIADELGLGVRGAESPERQLLAWLRDRKSLLILDSAEHLLDELAIIPDMLSVAPDLTLLVTSRERLHLPGEWVYAIGGLQFPRELHGDAFEGYDAVELLSERLRQVRSGAPLQHEERGDILRICQLVDGLPLGIELAAAWAHTLTVAEIADGIRQNLDFLQAPRGQPDHHLSMRAVFNSSWDMLTTSEQLAYCRLSVFQGGFEASAAFTVTDTTIQSLAALMSKSLLTRLPSGRYQMHQLLAQFGEELHQRKPSEHAAIHERHSRFYLGLLARQEALLRGGDQPAAIEAIENDLENIRAAWQWGVEHSMLAELADATFSYWLFFVIHGWMREGEAAFTMTLEPLETGALAAPGSGPDQRIALALARMYTAGFRSGLGRYDEAIAMLEVALPVLRDHYERSPLGLGLNMLAAALVLKGEHMAAQERLRESLAVFRESGDDWGTAFSLNDLGMVLYRHFQDDDGERFCAESREIFRRLGDRRGQAFAASNLARAAMERAEYPRALRLHREALALREEVDDRWGVAMSQMQLGKVLARMGDGARARDHLTRALRIAWNVSILPIVLQAMSELAAIDLGDGPDKQARVTLAAIASHPATPRSVRARAAELADEDAAARQGDPLWAARIVNDRARSLVM